MSDKTQKPKKTKNAKSSEKMICIVLVVVLLIIMLIYAIAIFECHKRQIFIFKPYIPKTPPGNVIFPMGAVTQLTAEEQEERNNYIKANTGN